MTTEERFQFVRDTLNYGPDIERLMDDLVVWVIVNRWEADLKEQAQPVDLAKPTMYRYQPTAEATR
jgi:hypothetical protein